MQSSSYIANKYIGRDITHAQNTNTLRMKHHEVTLRAAMAFIIYLSYILATAPRHVHHYLTYPIYSPPDLSTNNTRHANAYEESPRDTGKWIKYITVSKNKMKQTYIYFLHRKHTLYNFDTLSNKREYETLPFLPLVKSTS